MMKIPVLTVQQPYASAIMVGGKDIENRTRTTSYRGPILIHTSKSTERLMGNEHVDPWMLERWPAARTYPFDNYLGRVIGIATLWDAVDGPEGLGPWAEGPVCYRLRARFLLPPFPLQGMPGIFSIDLDAVPNHKGARDFVRAYASSKKNLMCHTCGEELPIDPALVVACPDCQAAPGVKCRRPSGHGCELHINRDALAVKMGLLVKCPKGPTSLAGRREAPTPDSATGSTPASAERSPPRGGLRALELWAHLDRSDP
jgi:hypothetical protein